MIYETNRTFLRSRAPPFTKFCWSFCNTCEIIDLILFWIEHSRPMLPMDSKTLSKSFTKSSNDSSSPDSATKEQRSREKTSSMTPVDTLVEILGTNYIFDLPKKQSLKSFFQNTRYKWVLFCWFEQTPKLDFLKIP